MNMGVHIAEFPSDGRGLRPKAKKGKAQGEAKSHCAEIIEGHGGARDGHRAANAALHVDSHLSAVFVENYIAPNPGLSICITLLKR